MGDTPLLNLLLEALQQTRDAVGIFDPEDRVVFCNRSFAALFDRDPEQATGRTFSELVRHVYGASRGLAFDAPDIEQFLKEVALKKRRSVPYRTFQNHTREGTWHQITQQVTGDNFMLMFATDISEQKAAEARERALAEKFKRMSETDELTGISNRRSFFSQVAKQLQFCERNARDGVMLCFDIDHFKTINDTHGHARGDEVLRALPALIADCIRPYDLFGRIGGEEFALFISDADGPYGVQIAERIRARVEQHDFGKPRLGGAVTLSIGVAQTRGSFDLEGLMHEADMALYTAKDRGRNCVCVAGQALPERLTNGTGSGHNE